ncbi:MAG: phosphoglycerate kinase [Candidatus Ancillula sp.]|nr:phosphoglycerate kinase [Candidatus Ancillula sp.]
MKTIEELGNIKGKKVLLRVDFNVPISKTDGKTITDDGRIRAELPTIKKLLSAGTSLIIVAHLGRPKPTTAFEVESEFSLAPVAKRLSQLLDIQVDFATDTVGLDAQNKVGKLEPGQVLLLENLRFNQAETSKDDDIRSEFAKKLADFADVFVSDGFGVVHREHASVYDVAKFLPSASGKLVQKEVEALSKVLNNPARPLTVILGGSKVSDKLGVIANLLKIADNILVGGGMAYTFLAALGYEIGTSLLEVDQIETVKGYIQEAENRSIALLLPVDIVVAKEFPTSETGDAEFEGIFAADEIPADKMGLDIGPETRKQFAAVIEKSKSVVWNGPAGVFEKDAYANGTSAIAAALVRAKEKGAFTVIGGGDSAAAVRILNNPDTENPFSEDDFSHISTGGGASLEFLEGIALPGIEVLSE